MSRTMRNREMESSVEQKKYKVGIYARLSVEGDERKNETIDNQIDIGKQYIKNHPEMILYDIYKDLGATGTNFYREDFERMMRDIRNRNINCVIVKDLSRFGRNVVETGNYIQKIFPFMKVRFVAVTDSIDTGDPGHMPDDLTINLKNLVNELYAKDISKKIKASRVIQWERGSYTGGIAPYGYKYEWKEKIKTLVIDPEAAQIVRDIYKMFLDGLNMKQISVSLFERKIHTPSCMHSSGNIYQQKDEMLKQWPACTIKMILTNPSYIGCLVQATTCGKKYQLRNRHDIDSDDFDVHLNTHEAIISEDDYFKVAQLFEKTSKFCNKKGFQKKYPVADDIYDGIIFCGDCNKKMARISTIKILSSGDRVRWYAYRCTNSDKLEIKCPAKGIAKNKLDELVMAALGNEFKFSTIRLRKIKKAFNDSINSQIAQMSQKRKKLADEITIINKKISEIYIEYRTEHMTIKEFQKTKNELESRMLDLKTELKDYDDQLDNKKVELERKHKFLVDLMKCKDNNDLTKEVISTLIKRIDIYADHRVKIQFAFCMSDLLGKELLNQ